MADSTDKTATGTRRPAPRRIGACASNTDVRARCTGPRALGQHRGRGPARRRLDRHRVPFLARPARGRAGHAGSGSGRGPRTGLRRFAVRGPAGQRPHVHRGRRRTVRRSLVLLHRARRGGGRAGRRRIRPLALQPERFRRAGALLLRPAGAQARRRRRCVVSLGLAAARDRRPARARRARRGRRRRGARLLQHPHRRRRRGRGPRSGTSSGSGHRRIGLIGGDTDDPMRFTPPLYRRDGIRGRTARPPASPWTRRWRCWATSPRAGARRPCGSCSTSTTRPPRCSPSPTRWRSGPCGPSGGVVCGCPRTLP